MAEWGASPPGPVRPAVRPGPPPEYLSKDETNLGRGAAVTPVLEARGLWKVFGPRAAARLNAGADRAALMAAGLMPAVCDVSLTVGQGEILVIMGLSGSGKSTVLRCLSRLIAPEKGTIRFQGRDILMASEAEMTAIRRHKMGMVFQHFALLPHLTVLENVAFPLEIQGLDRRRASNARAP